MKKNGQIQPTSERHFGVQLKAFLDREGRKYRWICDNSKINWKRLQRIFNGSEPTLQESQELANLFGLTLEDVAELDKVNHTVQS